MHLRMALNLYYTQARLHSHSSGLLKSFDISVQQYNILRILRGQKGKVISVSDISDRMIDKMPNTSRLIEKLRIKGLIERTECPNDRRKAEIKITQEGLEVVGKASILMDTELLERFKVLEDEEVAVLNNLLDKLNQ